MRVSLELNKYLDKGSQAVKGPGNFVPVADNKKRFVGGDIFLVTEHQFLPTEQQWGPVMYVLASPAFSKSLIWMTYSGFKAGQGTILTFDTDDYSISANELIKGLQDVFSSGGYRFESSNLYYLDGLIEFQLNP